MTMLKGMHKDVRDICLGNVLEDVAPRERELVADHVVTAMRALWPDMWGPRMEQILRHGLLALIE